MNTKPYYAVIFTNTRTKGDKGYEEMSKEMEALARKQPGFVAFESARGELGISVSYWEDLRAINQWKRNSEHLLAQKKGKQDWYSWYKVRVCLVLREYEFTK